MILKLHCLYQTEMNETKKNANKQERIEMRRKKEWQTKRV